MAMAFQDDDGSMSSPDPLNDSVPPSSLTRRITRSQRSQQFVSLGGPSVSPRRQTFELEVGNNRSPQKLFVTVESGQKLPPGVVRRRLFGSPSPSKTPVAQRRQQTTTTSVPLRDVDDSDEGASGLDSATPRRKGRPRKYAPTPKPGASLKKRVATPAKKATPGRPRKSAAGLPDEAPPENSVQETPRTTRSTRTTTSDATVEVTPASSRAKRKAVDEEPGSMAPPSTKKKRGRPRKTPAVIEEVPQEQNRARSPPVVERDSIEVSPAAFQSEPPAFSPPVAPTDNAVPESEGDIWMETLSDGPTPRPASLSRSLNFPSTFSGRDSTRQSPGLGTNDEEGGYAPATEMRDDTPSFSSPDAAEQQDSNIDDMLLVPQLANEAPSDIGTESSYGGFRVRPRDPDTIVQSEDFSMIFMDSLPPMQEDSNAMASLSASIGERTNLFINKTIQSIRNGMQSEDGDDGGFSFSDPTVQEERQQEQEADGEEREQRSLVHDSPPQGIMEADEEQREQYSLVHDSPPREIIEADEEEREQHSFVHDSPPQGIIEAYEEQREQHSFVHDSPPQEIMEAEVRHYEEASHYEDRHGDTDHVEDRHEVADHVEDRGELPEMPQSRSQSPAWEAPPDMAASQYQHPPPESRPELSPVRTNMSPGRSGSPRRTKALPLSRQLLTFKAMQSGRSLVGESPSQIGFSPSRSSPTRASANAGDESNLYEDSFSAIPEAVLEAATPYRPQHAGIPSSNQSLAEMQPESQGKEVASAAEGGTADTIRSDVSHLLTPEETPSPDDTDEVAGMMPMDHSDMELGDELTQPRSASPLLGTYSGQSFLTRGAPVQDKVTPVGPSSSPRLPALPDGNAYRAAQAAEQERRPTLSPIVRAGLALQSVTSDQSSPMGPRSTLRSPFKASVNSTPRPGSARPWGETEHAPTARPPAEEPDMPPSSDDPFGPSRINNGQASFMAALDETARQFQAQRTSQPAVSVLDTTRATFDDVDEMSWMAEDTIPAPTLADTLASRTSSLVANFGSVEGPQGAAHAGETGDAGSVNDDNDDDEEDEDIWVTEAQRPTPIRPRQQAFGSKPAPRPARRVVIPDTWRRSARATPAATASRAEQGQLEEYSLLPQQQQQQEEEEQNVDASEPSQGSSATKPGRTGGLDLSKFFSSPAALPPQSVTQARAERSAQLSRAARAPTPALAPNSMFPSVPQKEFQPSPARRNRLFSSAASASVAATSVAEYPAASSSATGGAGQAAAAPSTPERAAGLPAVEQKLNFTPRRGQASQSLFAPSSARSTAATAADAAAVTPPQMQLSRNDIERWQEETSVTLETSPADEPSRRPLPPRVAFAAQPPLPHKTMSPSKSCLRSPLKPRTPGRVVEFASTALSPLQQARARAASSAQRRRAAMAPAAQPRLAPPPLPPPPARAPVHDEDKENSPSEDGHMTDAPPSEEPAARKQRQRPDPTPPTTTTRLSQKTWTRDHWLLLDTFLQLRRKGPFALDLGLPAGRRRSGGLAGRVASAGGEAMEIEEWHLDVVDAFRAEVGGWEEGVLAKRVFALVVGEGRRAGGVV